MKNDTNSDNHISAYCITEIWINEIQDLWSNSTQHVTSTTSTKLPTL